MPFKANKEEFLGRTLFSGHYKNGKIMAGAFKLRDPSKGMSVNRITHAPMSKIDFLSKADAQRRTVNSRKKDINAPETNFYGYASIKAEHIESIRLDEGKLLGIKVTPNVKNAFHADIVLPVGESKDFYLLIADELLRKSTFCEPLE